MDPADRTDGELLGQFVDSGCHAAFDAVVRRHRAMVAGVCRRTTGRAHDAEDAAQAVFIALASKADELCERRSVAGWLHRTAWHVSLRVRRDAAARRRAESAEAHGLWNGAADGDDAGADALHAEARRELDRSLGMLSEEYREALVLHHLEGMTVAQVAELLNCPPGTVAARLSRGRSLLRERLGWRGFALVAASNTLAAALPDAAHAAEGSFPAAADLAAGAAERLPVPPFAAALPARPAWTLMPSAPATPAAHAGGAGGVMPAASAQLSTAASVGASAGASVSASAGAGVAAPLWFAAVGGRVTVALALGIGTTSAAAAAGYHVWAGPRPPASTSSAGSGTAGVHHSSVIAFPSETTPTPPRASRRASDRPPVRRAPAPNGGGPSGVVPEPSSLAVLVLASFSLLRRRR